jgi:hypothetical protein
MIHEFQTWFRKWSGFSLKLSKKWRPSRKTQGNAIDGYKTGNRYD